MDLHQRMNEALEEHLTVIRQLTAAFESHLAGRQRAGCHPPTPGEGGAVWEWGECQRCPAYRRRNAGYPCTSRDASGVAGARPDREYRPVHGHQ